jgi:hypothetical protein
MGRPQSRSGRYGEDTILLPLPVTDPRSFSPLSSRYTDGAIKASLTTQRGVRATCHEVWKLIC